MVMPSMVILPRESVSSVPPVIERALLVKRTLLALLVGELPVAAMIPLVLSTD